MRKDTAMLNKIMRAGFWLNMYAMGERRDTMYMVFTCLAGTDLNTLGEVRSLQQLYIPYDVSLSDDDVEYWTKIYGGKRG